VATILMIFLRVLPKTFMWPHYLGAQEIGGPGSLNRLNPQFLRHLLSIFGVASYEMEFCEIEEYWKVHHSRLVKTAIFCMPDVCVCLLVCLT